MDKTAYDYQPEIAVEQQRTQFIKVVVHHQKYDSSSNRFSAVYELHLIPSETLQCPLKFFNCFIKFCNSIFFLPQGISI